MLNVSPNSTDQLFAEAYAHHEAGRLGEAESIYRRILELEPAHADALHLLGVLACQVGKPESAIQFIELALALNPLHPAYHSNLGEACRKAGQFERAESHLRRALQLDPRFADAYVNLAATLMMGGLDRDQDAMELLTQGVAAVPDHAYLRRMLGDSLAKLNRTADAIAAYEQALRLDPGLTDARINLAAALLADGRPAEAHASITAVLTATPNDNDARLLLAETLLRLDRVDEAIAILHDLLNANPLLAQALSGLGGALRVQGRMDDAIAAYQRALALRPDHAPTRGNLALALRDNGRIAECMALLREALERNPDAPAVRSALIFSMFLDPDSRPEDIAAEQARWNELHVAPLAAKRLPHPNDCTPDRRLRIGYVSADFRQHPVGRFMLPLLRNHHRDAVEVFCFSETSQPDAMTAQLREMADQWRQISGMDDDAAAAAIRADAIDILIDLNNHTIGNRMTLFALKPAPVQISYLAYNAGTGLSTIDWRLTDAWIDPPDVTTDAVSFEKPLRLAHTYWCYAPHPPAGEVRETPALARGHVTFGSFNFFCKLNDRVLDLWSAILHRVPNSRLVLHVPSGSPHQHVAAFLAARNIEPARFDLLPRVDEKTYFENYGKFDIALDPFPWAGGTTTCDALWMGVPVATLRGAGTLARGGASLLSNLDHADWIAHSPEEYIEKAAWFASDISRLAQWRTGLRPRMNASPLTDASAFARDIEDAYRRALDRMVLKKYMKRSSALTCRKQRSPQ